jgi:regulator of sigma E protease
MIITVVATILILGLLIFFHELGHFLAAKSSDVYVEEFALGMGPILFSKQKGETLYSLRAIPIGGFVRMIGEDPEDEDDPRSLNRKTPLTRIFISIAGVVANIIVAIVIFSLIFMIQGVPSSEPVIGDILVDGPAEQAGLLPGDIITNIDGNAVEEWTDITGHVRPYPNQSKVFTITRNGTEMEFNVQIGLDESTNDGLIGISSTSERSNIFSSIKNGFVQTFSLIIMIFVALGSIFTGSSAVQGAGPVGIAQLVGEVTRTGLINTLSFTAMLSVNVGIFNALPIPPLDGSRILLIIVEVIRGKPIDPKKENLIYLIGFALLITFAVVITYQDILRLGQ